MTRPGRWHTALTSTHILWGRNDSRLDFVQRLKENGYRPYAVLRGKLEEHEAYQRVRLIEASRDLRRRRRLKNLQRRQRRR